MLQNDFFFDLNMLKTVMFICEIKYLSLFLTYKYQNGYDPTYIIVCVCVCVSYCSIAKKIAHCCFYIDKIKNEKMQHA